MEENIAYCGAGDRTNLEWNTDAFNMHEDDDCDAGTKRVIPSNTPLFSTFHLITLTTHPTSLSPSLSLSHSPRGRLAGKAVGAAGQFSILDVRPQTETPACG
ncbi:unnamed protein product [Pleuronectes platessa]|uniref:Uncharacterized protein n=1 Tax=Pleuronectes platessa TaxID=8262 RepID=A0A9N7V294_PLEPL|nr:unnamed protein product [Pleuronectes platessa]